MKGSPNFESSHVGVGMAVLTVFDAFPTMK